MSRIFRVIEFNPTCWTEIQSKKYAILYVRRGKDLENYIKTLRREKEADLIFTNSLITNLFSYYLQQLNFLIIRIREIMFRMD